MKKDKKEKNEVDDDGERADEVEEEEGNKKEVEEDKGKQKEVEEEEGKNKEVVEEEEEKINEVDEDKGKQKEVEEEEQEKNEVEDDGIKTINAHTFPVHLQPNATGDSIMRSAMGKPFDTFRITLKQNGLEDFFRNSCFGHFLDLPENNNARFQMTMVYEHLKRRFIFQNPKKKDEVLINYCGMPLFFGRREFAIFRELQMPYLITLGLVETLFDPVVDKVKMELAGARTIKRDKVVNELVVFDGVDGRGIDVGAGAGAGQDQRATSCRRCSGFLCEKCKK
ncbi:hypothetical protein R3W88_011989 [Solanum pinnatisectum]|uniref:Uncharacterized protein n=1 Tax=Solanum pinnatisectum TaxID=50273 RepID=A0AAV9L858_9SOLN|nr:hypothetical protein R3W88_011989 [Solanum pinnatisectum]